MGNAEKIRKALLPNGLDAVIITSAPNRFYATGFSSSAGIVVITKSAATFITDFRYIEAATAKIKDAEVRMIARGEKYHELARDLCSGCKKIGIEDASMTVAEYRTYKKAIEGAELMTASGVLADLRSSKEEGEIAIMRDVQRITDRSFAEILGEIHEGMTEKELAAKLIYILYKNGADGMAFDPIVVSGANSSLPHGVPGEKKLQKGDFITMDFGAAKDGYCSDMTRTVALGYATDEMKKVYGTVLEAQLAGIAAAKAGIVGRDLDKSARDIIDNAGYGEYFGHSFGHSLGIEIHEPPNASPGEPRKLPVNAVVSAEPGIYLPGKFGVRIEDVLILKEGGCEDITASPKELIIV